MYMRFSYYHNEPIEKMRTSLPTTYYIQIYQIGTWIGTGTVVNIVGDGNLGDKIAEIRKFGPGYRK